MSPRGPVQSVTAEQLKATAAAGVLGSRQLGMVMSEVAKDPPSPFVTVQSACDGILLPTVTPPSEQQQTDSGSDGSKSWACAQPCGPQANGHSFSGLANQRTHLQSIVSQQSLNFSTPPDSPFEFEHALNSIATASAVSNGQHSKLHQAAAAAGHHDFAAHPSAQHMRDTPALPDSSKHRVLRLLHLGGGWLRPTQSVPHCTLLQKRQHPSAHQLGQQQELSFKQIRSVLDKQDIAQDDLLHPELHPGQCRKLKTRVHKLLAWASGRVPSLSSSATASPQVHTAPLGGHGSLTFVPGFSSQQQQPQGVPIPWQHQVFSEPTVQPSVQLINATPGEAAGISVHAAGAS